MSPSLLLLSSWIGPALPTVTDEPPPAPPAPAEKDQPRVTQTEPPPVEDEGPTVVETKPPPVADEGPSVVETEPGPPEPAEIDTTRLRTEPKPPPAEREPKPTPSTEAIARQSEVELGAKRRRRGRFERPGSPQRFELEFKLGPYLPAVDRRFEGSGLGPYATIFGQIDETGAAVDEPKPGLMPVLGFEWQFFYLAGPLGLGTQVGFFRDSANALIADPDPGENLRSQADKVKFWTIPVSLLLVYRFELLADRFKVPLVPYAKGGAAYGFWWTKDGNGIAENSQGEKGFGGVWGWQINAGGMLRLDFIEPGTAKKLDVYTGINHTYLFGEYQLLRLANFGAENAIAIGDGTWFVGLAIEF